MYYRFCKVYCSLWCMLFSWMLQAQDTIQLKTVSVEANSYQKYAVGSKRVLLDSTWLAQYNTQNLGEALLAQTPIYIKQYGNGMLASVSMRGMGAGHTSVLWNGININSPTLGQMDFSLLSAFAYDNVAVQYGSSSSLFGSDALGGTILLNTANPDFEKNYKLSFQQDIGSFGRYFSGLRASYSNQKWAGNTSIYRMSLDNNFSIKEKTGVEKTIKNAEVLNYGLLQDVYYRVNAYNVLSLNGWYHYSDRGLQNYGTTQKDEGLRLIANYYHNGSKGLLNAKAGYIKDYLLYNSTDQTLTHRVFANIQYETELGKKISLQTGMNWNHIWMDVDNYDGKPQQDRLDLFAMTNWQIVPRISASLNLRQAFVSGFDSPFAPALGAEWKWIDNSKHQLLWKNSASQSYRIPNLNAMYWNPGGNPDIKSEKGVNWESGLKWRYVKNKIELKSEVTYYQMHVNDWILWRPLTSYWAPENLKEVQVRGVEVSASVALKLNNWKMALNGNYAYTKSTNLRAIDDNDILSINKQLPFVPFNRFTTTFYLSFRQWYFNTNLNYTDIRFTTTDNLSYIEGFTQVNASLGKHLKLNQHLLIASFYVNNVLDKLYYNIGNQAMPMRNYNLSIRYQFNSSSK